MSATGAAGRRVVVLGGSSEIALAIVRELARSAPREVVLVGRDLARLAAAADSLAREGVAAVSTLELDAEDTERHEAAIATAFERLGGADLVLLAVGKLGERGGTIVVLSSVAAERARARNAVYGAAKAGLDALAQALGDALHRDGVRIMVVRPGFVRTRMTAGLAAAPLAVDAAEVARRVVRGLERGEDIVWAPAALRWVMALLRALPRPLFRRLPV